MRYLSVGTFFLSSAYCIIIKILDIFLSENLFIITLQLQKSSDSEYCTTEWWFALIVSFPPLDAFSPFVWRHMKCVKSKLYLLWNWNVWVVAIVIVVVVVAAAVAVTIAIAVAVVAVLSVAAVVVVAVVVVAVTVTVVTTILDDGILREDVNISNLAEQKWSGKVFRLNAHVATIETISIDFFETKAETSLNFKISFII